MKLILASKSPRRAELLQAACIPFTVRIADTDETPLSREDPSDYVLRVARDKALAVPCSADELILAADTTVVLDSEILGKPLDTEDAVRMLSALQGRRHEVMTGICLRSGSEIATDCAVTAVWFAAIPEEQLREYAASGEPMDKAGAYGIQGLASRYIERIEGSYSNVVGLPVALFYSHYRRMMLNANSRP